MSKPNFLRMALFGVAALALAGQAIAASPVAPSPEAARLDSYVKADGTGYFALSLTPPEKLRPASAHDVVVLFDTSASQTGKYREKALAALSTLLHTLGAQDRVHLMAVDLNAVAMTPGFVSPESAEMQAALERLNRRVPLGSTDLAAVFTTAARRYGAKSANARAAIYIGDGMSTAGLLDADEFHVLVAQLVKQRIPVSSYAVGPRLDTQLLAALANQTGGNVAIDHKDIDAKQTGAYLANAARGAVAWPTVVVWPKSFSQVYPQQTPPLRSDRDTIVLGKGKPSGSVVVSMTADSTPAGSGSKSIKMNWTLEATGSNSDFADLPALVESAKADGGVTLPTVGTAGLQEVRRLASNATDRLATLGEQAAVSGNVAGAERLVAEALRRDPDDPTALAVQKQLEQVRASGKSGKKKLPSNLKLERTRHEQATPPAPPKPSAPKSATAARAVRGAPSAERASAPNEGEFLKEIDRQRNVAASIIRVQTENELKDARGRMADDPEGVKQALKMALERVARAPELNPETSASLRDQIGTALREADRRAFEKNRLDEENMAREAAARDRLRLVEKLHGDQEKIKQLMDRFSSLMDEGHFEDAEESAAGEVQRIAPNEAIAAAAILNARTLRYTQDALELRVKRQKAMVDALAQCEIAQIPFNDNKPIIYPDPEFWQKITRERKKFAQVDLSDPSEAELKIRRALDQPTKMVFADSPLQDAIDYLKDFHGIEIQFDLKPLEEASITPSETPVTCNLEGISLRSGLKLMLSRVGDGDLRFLIKDEVLLITTKAKAEDAENFVRKVYPVADLVIPVQSGMGMGGMGMMGMMGGMGGGMGGMGGGMGGMGGMGGGMGGMGGMGGGMGGMGGGFFTVPDPIPLPRAGGFQAFAIQDDLKLSSKKPLPAAAQGAAPAVGLAKPAVVKSAPAKPAMVKTPPLKAAAPAGKHRAKVEPIHLTLDDNADPDAVWNQYFADHQDVAPEVVRETARQLMHKRQFDHAIAMIRAALCQGQPQPWMYEALGLAMQAAGRPADELERTLMSAADFTDSPEQLILLAHYMSQNGLEQRALKLYAQVARLEPLRPEPYLFGLRLAQRLNNAAGIKWASLGILKQEWLSSQRKISQEAQNAALDVVQRLKAAGRTKEAAAFQVKLKQAMARDVRVTVAWTGDADVDLSVEEPAGSICSFRNTRTAAGGVLLGNTAARDGQSTSKGYSEAYVCPEAFSGNYRMLLRRVWGKVTAGKVNVDVYSHMGTPQETHIHKQIPLGDQDAVVVFDVNDGRRTEPVAEQQLANAVAGQLEVNRAILAQSLNSLTDTTSGSSLIGSRQGLLAAFPIVQNAVGYRPQIIVLPAGASLSATGVISADRRYVRVTPMPQFTQIGQVTTFNLASGATRTGQPPVGGGGLPPPGVGGGGGGGGAGGGGVNANPFPNPNPIAQPPAGNPM